LRRQVQRLAQDGFQHGVADRSSVPARLGGRESSSDAVVMRDHCAAFAKSTFYAWLDRYAVGGLDALEDRK
jgi:hypothetical protein